MRRLMEMINTSHLMALLPSLIFLSLRLCQAMGQRDDKTRRPATIHRDVISSNWYHNTKLGGCSPPTTHFIQAFDHRLALCYEMMCVWTL